MIEFMGYVELEFKLASVQQYLCQDGRKPLLCVKIQINYTLK